MTFYGSAKTFKMKTFTYDIKIIIYHLNRFLSMLHAESHPKYLVLVQQNVFWYMERQLNLANNQLSVVIYLRNKILYLLHPVLNQAGMHTVIHIIFKVNILQGMYGVMAVMTFIDS